MSHKHTRPSRWRRKILGLPVTGWLAVLILGGGIALAVLISSKPSAPDPISARAIGNVDIGSAETNGVFTQDLANLDPGDSFTSCVGVRLTDPIAGDAPKIYAGAISGALASELDLTIEQAETGTNVGHAGCNTTTWTPVYDGTLAGYPSADPNYAGGTPWIGTPSGAIRQFRFVLTLPADADPQSIAGETASLQVVWENQGGA